MTDEQIRAMYKEQGYYVDGPMFNPITESMRCAAEIFHENITHPDAWIIINGKKEPIADLVEYHENTGAKTYGQDIHDTWQDRRNLS